MYIYPKKNSIIFVVLLLDIEICKLGLPKNMSLFFFKTDTSTVYMYAWACQAPYGRIPNFSGAHVLKINFGKNLQRKVPSKYAKKCPMQKPYEVAKEFV